LAQAATVEDEEAQVEVEAELEEVEH